MAAMPPASPLPAHPALHIRRLFGDDTLGGQQSSLHSILAAAGSDKATHHGYTRYYSREFEPLRAQAIRLVEIGVEKGRSMKAWQSFFANPATHVYGIGYGNWQTQFKTDCNEAHETRVTSPSACTVFRGDQSNTKFLNAFLEDSGGRFDIVIDDGSHVPDHQRITFETLWPSVVPGGLYAIEDVETSYWREDEKVYGYELRGQRSIVEHMQAVAHAINREFTNGETPLPELYNDVSTVMFAQNLIILRKQTKFEASHFFNRTYRLQTKSRPPTSSTARIASKDILVRNVTRGIPRQRRTK